MPARKGLLKLKESAIRVRQTKFTTTKRKNVNVTLKDSNTRNNVSSALLIKNSTKGQVNANAKRILLKQKQELALVVLLNPTIAKDHAFAILISIKPRMENVENAQKKQITQLAKMQPIT